MLSYLRFIIPLVALVLGGFAGNWLGDDSEEVDKLKITVGMSNHAVKELQKELDTKEKQLIEVTRVSIERQERALYWNNIADRRKDKFEKLKTEKPEVEDWANTVQPASIN